MIQAHGYQAQVILSFGDCSEVGSKSNLGVVQSCQIGSTFTTFGYNMGSILILETFRGFRLQAQPHDCIASHCLISLLIFVETLDHGQNEFEILCSKMIFQTIEIS